MSTARNANARRSWLSPIAAGLAAGLAAFTLTTVAGSATAPSAQAADSTSSAVTVTAAQQDANVASAPFPNLSLTVSQTAGLQQQAVTVSWTGAAKSSIPTSSNGGQHYLQIFQCWGDDPTNSSRPDRTTCQYGATSGPGAARNGNRASADAVASQDEQYTVPARSAFDPTYTSIPFKAYDGTVVTDLVTDSKGNKSISPSVDVNSNTYFTNYTSNEVPWAGSDADGNGSVPFEIQTVMQSNGLGCGTPLTASDGSVTGSSCWLVVVPRGTADNGEPDTRDSGLFWDSWQHALAVRLKFSPIGVRCPTGQTERQVAGSELVTIAMNSWQPVICNSAGGSVFSLLTSAESDSVTTAATATPTASPPLAATILPLDTSSTNGTDPLQYAPIALTGISIGFSIDGNPDPYSTTLTDAQKATAQQKFTSMNLTPRLLAKLLTNSYISSIPPNGTSEPSFMLPSSATHNPVTLMRDPEFLKYNPDWVGQSLSDIASIADLLVPQGRSDAAIEVWKYVEADADAKAFLGGQPDQWGMRVNPWSSTSSAVNPSGTGMNLPREDFPKSDPIDIPATSTKGDVNLVAYRPYTSSLDQSGYLTLRGDGQLIGEWDTTVRPPKFAKTARRLPGFQEVIGLTDVSSATRYQVTQASLLNSAGNFVAPSTSSMLAAASAMTAIGGNGQVLGYVPGSDAAKAATNAYPLTVPVYAAANPAIADTSVRVSYANLIRYAVSTGQVSGTDPGQLPAGYTPLPSTWVTQAVTAAAAIQTGVVTSTSTASQTGDQSIDDGDSVSGTSSSSASSAGSASTAASGTTAASGGVANSPSVSGPAASSLVGVKTPKDPSVGALGAALPIGFVVGLISAFAVPILSRLRRRVS